LFRDKLCDVFWLEDSKSFYMCDVAIRIGGSQLFQKAGIFLSIYRTATIIAIYLINTVTLIVVLKKNALF